MPGRREIQEGSLSLSLFIGGWLGFFSRCSYSSMKQR